MKIVLISIAIIAFVLILVFLINGLFNRRSHYQVQTTIAATPEQIFPFLTEGDHLKKWISGFVDSKVIRGQGTEPGAVAHISIKEGDRLMVMESEVLEVVTNEKLVVRLTALDGPRYQGISNYQLVESDGKTQVTVNMDYELGSFLLRGIAPLFQMIGRKTLCNDFDQLKQLVESSHASSD